MSKFNFTYVKAGRVQPNDIIEDWERPRFGFYWWFWIPTYHSNGGKFRYKETVDVSIHWLCFSIGFIYWGNLTHQNG